MTIQNIINEFSLHPIWLICYFGVLFLLTLITNASLKPSNTESLKYVLSSIVFGVSIPGILALMLTVYAAFMLGNSLLEMSMVVYFLPIIAMAGCLYLMSRKVHMKDIPGFGRLSGLFLMIGLTFLIIFVLSRMYFGVIFLGSITHLLIAFLILFLLIRFAWSKIRK